MRWMWVDRIVELIPGERAVGIKCISMAEEQVHDHFARDEERGLPWLPVMPASLIIEGMAQTAGLLVGHARGFKEKVVLGKVSRVELDEDVQPGVVLRYTARLERIDESGAATVGVVEVIDPAGAGSGGAAAGHAGAAGMGAAREIGRIDLMFSHVDKNMAGLGFPEHNFVFGEQFRVLLGMGGVG